MRIIAALLCFLTFFPAGVGAAAENQTLPVTRAEIIRFLGQLPELAPIREDMMSLGFRGQNLELAVRQAEIFYTDPLIAGHIADQVIAVYSDKPTAQQAEGLIWPLIDRGLGHLSTRELQYFYQVEHTMIMALPTRQCGLAVRNRLSPQAQSDAMSRVAARLNTPALKEYYRLQHKAARFGVRRDAVRLSPAAQERTEALIERGLLARINASSDPDGLKRAMVDLDNADNARACAVGEMFYASVMDMKGPALRDALIYLGMP